MGGCLNPIRVNGVNGVGVPLSYGVVLNPKRVNGVEVLYLMGGS